MKKKMLYVISALLAVFYLLVLWWGKNPCVGTEYKMYYITHELSDWPGYGKLAYQPGQTEYCTELKDLNGKDNTYNVCRRKGKGWRKWQYEGSVSEGQESFVYYILDNDVDNAVLALNINKYSGNSETEVYCNDVKAGTFSESGNFNFQLGNLKKNELVTIKFKNNGSEYTLWSLGIIVGDF